MAPMLKALPHPTSPAAHASIALLAVLAACGGKDQGQSRFGAGDAPAAPPPLVRAEPAALRPVQQQIETTSYLESEHRVTILPEVAGRLTEMLVDEGDRVTAGQRIAQLDDREVRTALLQNKVQLEDRRVRLELAQLEAESAEARVQQARIEANRTRTELERNQSIDPGLIPLKQIQEAEFAADAAAEALRVAEFDSRKAVLEVRAAEAAIRELEARVEEAELRVREHEIQAPIDGLVESVQVRGGETISAATELCTLVDDDDLVTYLRRPQRELPTVEHAERVVFTTDAYPGREFEAHIDLISPTIDESSGSFRIRVRVRREDTKVLRPGMFVRASILTEAEREALMVPKTAVLNDGRDAIVFAVRDGIAKRIVIDRGIEERDYVECRNRGGEGLVPGDLVVVSGQQGLSDDTVVELVRELDENAADDTPDGEASTDGSSDGDANGTATSDDTSGDTRSGKAAAPAPAAGETRTARGAPENSTTPSKDGGKG
jgi:RND family efflux transporter MFP subunit